MRNNKKENATAAPVIALSVVTPELKDLPPFAPRGMAAAPAAPSGGVPAAATTPSASGPLSLSVQDWDKNAKDKTRVRRMTLGARCTIGRRTPDNPGEYTGYAVVYDPTQQVSRRHMECGTAGPGRAWIMDTGSANGTWVATSAGRADCVPYEKIVIEPGDVVHFGTCTAWLE